MYKALVKYQCRNCDCEKGFLTKESSQEVEKTMVCPFCKSEVESAFGGNSDIQDFYDGMGCLYPGGGKDNEK